MNNNSIFPATLRKLSIYSILGLAFTMFAACTPQPGSLPQSGQDLTGTKWELVSFNEAGAETPVIEASTISIEFDSDGQAGGSGGCNAYSAPYEVRENMLSFGEITHTMMACEQEEVGQQEQRYFQALENAGGFELTGDRLTISYSNEQGMLILQIAKEE